MKYTADCPACAERIPIPNRAAAQEGVRCPKCSVGFVPSSIVEDGEYEEPPQKSAEETDEERRRDIRNEEVRHFDELLQNARACFGIGLFFMVGFAGCIVGALGSRDEDLVKWLVGAGGTFGTALIPLFFSQLFSIRAALQKQFLKDSNS